MKSTGLSPRKLQPPATVTMQARELSPSTMVPPSSRVKVAQPRVRPAPKGIIPRRLSNEYRVPSDRREQPKAPVHRTVHEPDQPQASVNRYWKPNGGVPKKRVNLTP